MSSPFFELSLSGIEEGRFLDDANGELIRLQSELLKHIRKYSESETAGASAELTIKVKLQSLKDPPDMFAVKTSISTKLPGRPDHVSAAVVSENEKGQPTLFCRRSGTNKDDPRQGRLSTEDGREIDQETGEAAPLD